MSATFILKRASASRSSGEWKDKDYDVLADGKVVGRIYEDASASTPPDMRWFWSLTGIVPAVPIVTNGHAMTREEAMAKFRLLIRRRRAWIARRLMRAWALSSSLWPTPLQPAESKRQPGVDYAHTQQAVAGRKLPPSHARRNCPITDQNI